MRIAHSARTILAATAVAFALLFLFTFVLNAQSKPERQDPAAGNGKKNKRPTAEEQKKAEEEKKRAEEEKNAIIDPDIERVESNVVNVEAVVYNKKTGQIVTGLKKENFAIFENGVKQNITGFATPEAPITVTLVLEYSGWSQIFGRAGGGGFQPGLYETVRPVADFLTGFIKPPNDYASVIAFDMRPRTITDFTNDPGRIRETVNTLLRSYPTFRESNLYDALKLALVGGKGDSIMLENSKNPITEYAGMTSVKSKRKAIILVASGIDTFSKINYNEIRRITQEAGVPIYIISTANLFCKLYCDRLDPDKVMPGLPDRSTFLMAQNVMNTFAKESGGIHFAMTFEQEVPDYLRSINALLRNQYSLSYDLGDKHAPGTKYNLTVKVDVAGDGTFDDKNFVVQHRPFFMTPKTEPKKK